MKIYNTLTRTTEIFEPLNGPKVTLYTCGPTVYHYAHIGNLRCFLFYDLLKRVLTHNGYDVVHVMNITDVGHLTDDADAGEDKMEKGARREGKTAWEVAKFYTDAFLKDMDDLGIIPPTHQPKATDYIQQQIDLIVELEKKGFTYTTSTGVAFDTSKFPDYAKLSKMNIEQLKEGARVEADNEKRNITDFYLWKFSPADHKRDMEWESPWGVGFPGWHVECSAMAIELLGETIDIHCGGIDHIPVHHTNEIAQSEGATGKQFSRYWMHNNFLNIAGGVKMAKSGDNFYTLQKVVDLGFEPMVFRYMMLTAQYSSELEFSVESLHQAQQTLENIRSHLYDAGESVKAAELNSQFHIDFYAAMDDDLNSPEALSILHSMLKSELSLDEKRQHLIAFDDVLGLGFADDAKKSAFVDAYSVELNSSASAVELLKQRANAREEKNWEKSDEIRAEFENAGYVIEDTKDGQKIKRK